MTRPAPTAVVLTLVLLLAFVMGCATAHRAPVQPPLASVYTKVNAPLDTDMDETQLPAKRGEASTHNVLGLVAWGDASIPRAAQQGGIETVHHADYEFVYVLGLYSRFTTIVRGE